MKRIALLSLLLASVLLGFQLFATVEPAPSVAAQEAPGSAQEAPPREFDVPEGFAVEEVYAPDQAGSVVAITFDSQGELVISREDSSSFRLFDTDGDGVFDEEQLITDQVTNSQGMVFDGADMLVVGNGPEEGDDDSGIYRIVDEDEDGQGDRVEVITRAVDGMQEHGPHNPFFGPDGYLYWTMGNHTDIRPSAAPLSPLNEWDEGVLALASTDARGHASDIRAPGGKFYRKDLLDAPDSDWELVAGGFRNQYDGAFNMMGELFTYDSDMEWDRDLPWFRPTRTVHAVPGGDFGWRTGSRKHPRYYIDTLPPLQEQGRGSPVGVEFYQSYNYPEAYRDLFLQGDWSRGRILMSRLERDGATYREASSDNFVYGEPLNVTDLDVGPDGNVYFSLGGRDTDGGLYRVVYTGPDAMERPETDTPIDEALTIPQPRSAYSRNQLRTIKTDLGESEWQQGLTAVVEDAQATPERRVRALELLQVYGPAPDEAFLAELVEDDAWEVRAAAAYYLGMHQTEEARRTLAGLLQDADPFVQRRAAEALMRTGVHPAMEVPFSAADDVFPLLASEDRFVRYAAGGLLRRMNRNDWREAAMQASQYPQAAEALMAYVQTIDNPNVFEVRFLIERELDLLEADPSNEELLQLIRVMQRTMLEDQGVIFEGERDSWDEEPAPGPYEVIGNRLLERFPTADSLLNREMARVFAYLEPPAAVGELVAQLDSTAIGREQQIMYAYALSDIGFGWDEAAVEQMITWFEKVDSEGWRGGASFTGFIRLMREDFLANVPEELHDMAAERLAALEEQEATAGIPAGGPAESPHNLSDQELAEELIYDPQSFDWEDGPGNGVQAYNEALCATCHTFGPIGREFGPDLTYVGQRFSRSDLVEAIIYPSRTVSDQWAVQQIETTDGGSVSGFVYSENAQEVVIQLPGGGLQTVNKSNIESRGESTQSIMPEGLHHYVDQDKLVDLLMLLENGPEAIPDSMRAPGSP